MFDCYTQVSTMSSIPTVVPNSTKVMDEEKKFRDCADLYQAGIHKNGVYTIQINPQETKKVRSRNILQPALHCNVNIAAFSSPLGRSYIIKGFTGFFLSVRNKDPEPPLDWWVWMMGASCCRNIESWKYSWQLCEGWSVKLDAELIRMVTIVCVCVPKCYA